MVTYEVRDEYVACGKSYVQVLKPCFVITANDSVIIRMADIWSDYRHWLTDYHPIQLIDENAQFYNGDDLYPIVEPEYRLWCKERYFKTGILMFKNSSQIGILEPGNFRVETYRD